MNCEVVEDKIPALALGALDDSELEEIKAHILACNKCKSELLSYTPVLDALNLSVDEFDLPTGFNRRLMKRINPQAVKNSRQGETVQVQQSNFTSKLVVAWGVAIVLLFVAILLGARAWTLEKSLAEQHNYDEHMVALMTSDNVQTLDLRAQGTNVRAKLYLSQDGREGVLMVSNLTPDSTYEVWLVGSDGKVMAATFTPLSNGTARVYLDPEGGLSKYQRIDIVVQGSSRQVITGDL